MKGRFAVVVLLLLIAAALVRADVIGPWNPWRWQNRPDFGPAPTVLPPGVPLVVAVDDRATEAHLIVPKKHMREIAALSGENDTAHASAGSRGWPVIGIPLAAALAVSGLWVTGLRPRLGKRGLVVLLGMIALGGAAAFAWGRVQLPTPLPPPPLKGKVTVEIVEDGDTVKLVLNREMLKDLMPDK